MSTPFGESLIFGCGPDEAVNLVIGLIIPEPHLDETARFFAHFADRREYTDTEFGRITADGKDHVWARYQMTSGAWTKKYMIVFGETECAVTATRFDSKAFAQREKIWDATVASFRRLPQSSARPAGEVEAELQGTQFFELGHSHFRAGHYQAALEVFERGKVVSPKYPWNFCGVSMTAMQMIEKEAVPPNQIPMYAEMAETNIDECLRIAPREPDYLAVKKRIREFRTNHCF